MTCWASAQRFRIASTRNAILKVLWDFEPIVHEIANTGFGFARGTPGHVSTSKGVVDFLRECAVGLLDVFRLFKSL
jgi:hypothetical protein